MKVSIAFLLLDVRQRWFVSATLAIAIFTAVCEQTWVDGRRMFDLEENKELQIRDRARHAALVQKIIRSEAEQRKPGEDDKNDDDLWARSDTYCHGHEHGHDE